MAIAHKRICILADNDIVMDGRIRKIARALGNAGAQVLVIGEGDPSGDQAAQLADEPFDIQIVQRDINDWERALGYSQPRLGREDVWWPLRVAVNLTYSKAKLFLCWARLRTRYSDYREKRFDSRFFNESMLRAAIDFEPDVVHANDVYMGKTAIAIAEQTDCKLVYDSHELFDSYFVSKTKNTLADKRICVLANNEIVLDGRIRKTARALSSAGAQVLVIGEGESRDLRLDAEPFQSIVVPFGFEHREQSWWHRALFFARRVLVRIARILLRVLRISIARNPLKARTSPTRLYNANMIEPAVAFAPDIVHVNDVFTGKVALEIAARTDSTIIYDSHELFDGYFTDHEDNALVQKFSDEIESRLLADAVQIFTASPLIAADISCRYPEAAIADIPNSLPGLQHAAAGAFCAHKPIRILSQSSMRRVSNENLSIAAMQHLKDYATLTLQGRCVDKEYLQELHDLVEQLGLQEVVTFADEFDPTQGVQIATGFDIGIANYRADSKSKELTLSNRIFTYMNAGLACALTDVAAHREFPHYNEFGILLDVSSAESIAEGLLPLLKDPERIVDMKQAAKERYAEFDWNLQEQRFIQAYADAITG